MRIYLLFFLSILTISTSAGQISDSTCYHWRSKHHKGDFVRVCLKKSGDFYYQWHQNDVIQDYYSKGTWQNISDTIRLTSSIIPPLNNYQIVKSGPKLEDSLNIKILNFQDKSPVSYCSVSLLDKSHRPITGSYTNIAGLVSVVIDASTEFLKLSCIITEDFLIPINLIQQRDIEIYMELNGLRFINVSKEKFILNKKGDLVNVDKKGHRTIYSREK
jgi:hypothetical protein